MCSDKRKRGGKGVTFCICYIWGQCLVIMPEALDSDVRGDPLTRTLDVKESAQFSCSGNNVKVHISKRRNVWLQFNTTFNSTWNVPLRPPEERKRPWSSSAGLLGFLPFRCCCDLLSHWFRLVWVACCPWHLAKKKKKKDCITFN